MKALWTIRYILLFLIFLGLYLVTAPAKADYVDVDKAVVMQMGYCTFGLTRYRCAIVELDGKPYLIAVDKKGLAIEAEYVDGNVVIIWARESI